MRYTLCVLAGSLAALACPAHARPDVAGRLAALAAEHAGAVEIATIGSSRQGRPLHLAVLAVGGDALPDRPAPDQRPALLIVAGANSLHRVGVETALAIAERLPKDHAALLETSTVYIVPMLNPDSFAFHDEQGRPRSAFGRTIWPHDADRDGRTNEDPGEDLNGDGVISTMRLVDPPPGSPWPATLAADPENPRLMKTPDAAKGESARYAVFTEGVDNDGDGRFNEDGPGGSGGGGADLDLNMPYRWKEWGDGIGAYPLSEPESLALVKWMYERSNIAAVLVLGLHDTLVTVPQAGKFDDSGQVPLGIENDDKPYYEELSKAFKEITKMTGAPSVDNAGAVQGWTYAHFGVWTFATSVWVRPDLIKSDEPAKKDGEAGEKKEGEAKPEERAERPAGGGAPAGGAAPQPAGGGGQRAGQPGGGGGGGGGGRRFGGGGPPGSGGAPADQAKGADPEDAKWLKYSDEKREKAGFIEWTPFDHPQLGKVEIGGFVPGFKHNPPEDDLARLADEQTKFAAALLGKLPRVSLDAPVVEAMGPGLWRITVRATNTGYLPTMPAIGVKARRAMPSVVSLDVPMERIVTGQKAGRFWAIPGSGGAADQQWVITGDAGSTVTIRFAPTFGGEQSMTITLQEGAR